MSAVKGMISDGLVCAQCGHYLHAEPCGHERYCSPRCAEIDGGAPDQVISIEEGGAA